MTELARLRARAAALRAEAERCRRTSEEAAAYLPLLFTEARELDLRADRLDSACATLAAELRPEATFKGEEDYLD